MSVLPAAGVISFARGIPAPEMFPSDELAEASRRAFQRHGSTALNYGAPGGFRPLQEWLGNLHRVPADQVVITPGSCMLLSLLVRALMPAPGSVLVEAPTYDRMIQLLRRAGAELVSIPRRPEGLHLRGIEEYLAAGNRPAFFYLTPTFHNPTGTTLPFADRERLAELAIRYELLIVEDDPYGQLRFDGESLPSISSLLQARGAGHLSVFISSFSKIIAPGLRVGYGTLPEFLVPAVAEVAMETYVSPPLWPQAEVYEFLEAGFLEPHLVRVRELLRLRHDAIVERLVAGLAGQVSWSTPGGGYFLWLNLPSEIKAQDLLEECERAGVTFVPGSRFFAEAGGQNSARFAFSYPTVGSIRLGVDRVATIVKNRLDSFQLPPSRRGS
jgi:2-aminoadipate transaminase